MMSIAILAAIAIATCLVPLWFFGSHYAIHHDLAGSLMSGKLAVTLGDSFGDYSLYFPPAERVWASLAVHLSDVSGLRLDLSVIFMTSVAILVSTLLAYKIRRDTVGASPLFLIAPVVLLVVLPIVFKNVFGLREHLVALGLWPYLVLRLSDPDLKKVGLKMRIVVGLWLGTMLLAKYFYSVVVFLIELVDAVLRRRLSPLFRIENLIAGGIVAAYLFAWLVLDPGQRDAIRAAVSAIDANLIDPRANWLTALYKLPLAVYFLAAARIFQWPVRETLIGGALVVGALIVSAVQARWYTHHVFPITLAYIVWWWLVARKMQWWGHLAVALLIAMPIVPQYRSTASYQEDVRDLAAAIEGAGQSVDGKRVGVLAVHPSPYNQYLTAQGSQRWNATVNNAYVAAELMPFDKPENRGRPHPPVALDEPGRRMVHEEMLKLWEDMPPDVLILDHSRSWPLRYTDIDWQQAFSEDERFGAILADYRPLFDHEGERVKFTYYVRKDAR